MRSGAPTSATEPSPVLAGRHDVNVGRRYLGWPAQPELVVGLLADSGDGAGHPDTVRAHRDPDRLAVRAERIQRRRVGVLATELEDVPDFDAAVDGQHRSALRARVTGTDFGSLD